MMLSAQRRTATHAMARARFGRRNRVGMLSSASGASTTMEIDEYARTSKNQYAAHVLTRDALSACMKRLAQRSGEEDCRGNGSRGRCRVADLGSADGASTMATLKFAVDKLKTYSKGNMRPLHITFEEHPASDQSKLQSGLAKHNRWFDENNITHDVMMRSFYEPLFAPNSIDFLMSYICLHWLDTNDCEHDIVDWKTLGATAAELDAQTKFVQVNETTVPPKIREAWRVRLAHKHLAKFFALRSKELKPGAEALFVMVGHPHEYLTPSDGGPGPLTRAMERCRDRDELREEVLCQTLIPYFLRTSKDVETAFEMAATIELNKEFPGALLDLIDCRSIAVNTAGDEADKIDAAFDLFWSIHSNSVINLATSTELACIKTETRRVFHEIYDAEVGVRSTFVACTIRKREDAE